MYDGVDALMMASQRGDDAVRDELNIMGSRCVINKRTHVQLYTNPELTFIPTNFVHAIPCPSPRPSPHTLLCYVPKVAMLLIRTGAAVDHASNDGLTPLLVAVRAGHVRTARMLLRMDPADGSAGGIINATTNDGTSAIEMAMRMKDEAMVKALVNAGCDVNLPGRDGPGWTPLRFASERRLAGCIKILSEAGALMVAD